MYGTKMIARRILSICLLLLLAISARGQVLSDGISGRIFKVLGEEKINIRTIEQGADEINIMIGVYTEDFEKTIRVLYESFAL